MKPIEQIEKLKGHVLLFSENLRSLVQTLEMLRPVAEDADLLRRYSGTDRVLAVRWSTIQECLIGITKLAFDQQPNNPSAVNLISELLSPEAEAVREGLKAKFVIPILLTSIHGRELTEQDLVFRAEIEKQEIKELEAAFEKYLEELCQKWSWFEKRRNEFKRIRDSRLAHSDTSKVGSDYVLGPVDGPDWKTTKGW
jgi:hypothetical protein